MVMAMLIPSYVAAFATTTNGSPVTSQGTSSGMTPLATSTYPVGNPDGSEPSGEAPPASTALAGYQLSYINDFTGSTLPAGWSTFSGVPGGDQGSLWAPSHVTDSGGMLQLNAYQDPAFNNAWVTGGISQSGVAHTYGAYFVRSKLTGAGPSQVEMLWPTVGWPPEIDFNETTYSGITGTVATDHYDANNDQINLPLTIDMTQWHTWGVIWSPSSIIFTVDGNEWGSVTVPSEIPDQPMTLDITQQTWCTWGFDCPSAPQSTQVDWVAEYTTQSSSPVTTTTVASRPVTTTVTQTPVTTTTVAQTPVTATTVASRPVTTSVAQPPATTTTVASSPVIHPPVTVRLDMPGSSGLTPKLKTQITRLAKLIKQNGDSRVVLFGFSGAMSSQKKAIVSSKQRTEVIAHYLEIELARFGVTKVRVSVIGVGSSHPIASIASISGRALNRRVVVRIS